MGNLPLPTLAIKSWRGRNNNAVVWAVPVRSLYSLHWVCVIQKYIANIVLGIILTLMTEEFGEVGFCKIKIKVRF